MKNKTKIIFHYALYTLCFMVLIFWGYATADAAESPQTGEIPVITGIDLEDYSITIRVDKPFSYTLYKPEDPYKIVVELYNVNIGAFTKKIVSEKAGITEIVPSQVKSPTLMARLDILLQIPSKAEPEYVKNALIIRIGKESIPGIIRKEEEIPEKKALEKEEPIIAAPKKIPLPKKEEPIIAAPKKIPLPKATEITDISFEQAEDTLKVIIKGNGSMEPNVFPLDTRIVIDVPDVVMKASVPSAVVSPLKGIRSGKHDGEIRFVLDLQEKTDFDVTSIGDSIVIALLLPVSEKPLEKVEIAEVMEKVAEVREIEYPVEGKYTGKKISLDFQDVDIVPIFRLLADISGYNVVVSPEVKGKLTLKLINVPWDQALDIILKTFGLGKSFENNVIRIAPHSAFAKESEEAAKAKEAELKAEPLEAKTSYISYAKISDIEKAIKDSKILSSRGSISGDVRTSSIIVNDIAAVFPKVENLINTLDKATPQVMIEARIVEISTSDIRRLGIQWGVSHVGPTPFTQTPYAGYSPLNTGPFTGNNFMVDFPAPDAGAGAGAGFAFGILNHARTGGLDLQLSALQTLGKGKLISSPKVVTTDNEKATIMQGESIPYPQATAEGTISAAFKDVVLSIEVTPHITPANSISMNVKTIKEDFKEFVRIGLGDAPRTTKVEGMTKVLIQNGETLVIGGVYKKKERTDDSGVPGLMKIPIIKWLFKSQEREFDVTELLIFITPRILEKPT